MKKQLPVQQRSRWLAKTLSVLREEWHSKRADCFERVICGLLNSRRLGIAAIGRHLPGETSIKHSIKAVDRSLSSELDLVPLWRYFLGQCRPAGGRRLELALDWTDLGGALESLVLAAPHDGRALPVAWTSFIKGEYSRSRNAVETTLCRLICGLVDGPKPLLLMDRGFARARLFRALGRHQIPFIVRIKRGTYIMRGEEKRELRKMRVARGQVRDLGEVELGIDARVPVRVVLAWGQGRGKKQPKEPWVIATSLPASEYSGAQVAAAYTRRFNIEQNFRDHKSLRFGLQMRAVNIASPKRWDALLAVAAVAAWVFTNLGRHIETTKQHLSFRANTAKHRTHSLHFLGMHFVDKFREWSKLRLGAQQFITPFS